MPPFRKTLFQILKRKTRHRESELDVAFVKVIYVRGGSDLWAVHGKWERGFETETLACAGLFPRPSRGLCGALRTASFQAD